MKLFHATMRVAGEAILNEGFAKSNLLTVQRKSSFTSNPADARMFAAGSDVLVVVEMPAEVAEPYRDRLHNGEPYLDNYLIPWDVVNQYSATFSLEDVPPASPNQN